MDSNDEELPVFKEEVARDEEKSNHEDEGPSEPIQPVVIPETRKIPNWLKSTLLDAEGHGATKGIFRESKKPYQYQGCVAAMTTMIQVEPPTFEEVVKKQVWKDGRRI